MQAGSRTDQTDEDVKHFSGTATYSRDITVVPAQKAAGTRLYLDPGDGQNLARVRLNGRDPGAMWKAPYVVEITAVSTAGANRLELEITNTWLNRLVGDAGKPQEQRVTWAGSIGKGFSGGPGGSSTPEAAPAGLPGRIRLLSEVKIAAL